MGQRRTAGIQRGAVKDDRAQVCRMADAILDKAVRETGGHLLRGSLNLCDETREGNAKDATGWWSTEGMISSRCGFNLFYFWSEVVNDVSAQSFTAIVEADPHRAGDTGPGPSFLIERGCDCPLS